MAILPFRGLAERGILYDPSPYQLDMNAWSAGAGIRFHGNKAMRAPIWRSIIPDLGFDPRYCFGYRPSTGYDLVFLADDAGNIYKALGGVVTNLTPTGHRAAPTTSAYTGTFLGDVTYINRPSDVPYYYGPSSVKFAVLPNWDSTWRCRSLRAFGSFLIAMNVTKGTQTVKTMVKWSDLTLAGQVPGSWDATDSTKNAGENVIQDMDSGLVDGCAMRSVFVLYTSNQVWTMTPVPNQEVFTFRRLFSEGGIMAPNCVVEVDGKHYVFGPSDIYVHDGLTKTSIIDQRNRDYVFRNLDARRSEVCFASFDPRKNEVTFGYNSGEKAGRFSAATQCNRGAVYNTLGNTWSFIDLPNVSAITEANLDNSLTYATAGARGLTPANVGGTYYDQDSGFAAHSISVSSPLAGALTTPRMIAYDFLNKGVLSYPYEPEANTDAFLERTGLDLDQVGSDLTTYKNIRRVYPLVTIFDGVPVQIEVGGSLTPSGAVTWGPKVPFNPVSGYKVDSQHGGRYLAIRFSTAAPSDFEINGFDVEVGAGGRR